MASGRLGGVLLFMFSVACYSTRICTERGAMITLLLTLSSLAIGSDGAAGVPDAPTFTRDIAPIFQAKCQECHRPDQMAPMSLLTYEETRPWAKSILKEVASRRMPPFHVAGPIGHWKDDLRLEDIEIETIVRWVNQGVVRGDQGDLPEPRVWSNTKWPLGAPDLEIVLPAHTISSSGTDDYVYLYSDYVFPEDMWLSGVAFHAEYLDTVHHAHIFMWPEDMVPPEGKMPEEHFKILDFPAVYTWFPGLTVDLLPEGQAIAVSRGDRFGVMAHFAPRTDVRVENLSLGVYFANGTIDRVPGSLGVMMPELSIPPYSADYELRKAIEFSEDVTVTHFGAHMHLRGKSVRYYFHYPNGPSELVFDLPAYDFDWQRFYYLKQPIPVKKGTVLEAVVRWDNSADNPHNPDPSQNVRWGARTADEMFGGNAYYTPVATLDQPVVVANGRRVAMTDEAESGS